MSVILGCGDIGRRIAQYLIDNGEAPDQITTFVVSESSYRLCRDLGVVSNQIDLDEPTDEAIFSACAQQNLYYTVPPQKQGVCDHRSENLLRNLDHYQVKPNKIVLISTTGVYGDCGGDWVTEDSPVQPQTERGQRRWHAQQVWQEWAGHHGLSLVVLRVPGIYAFSRLPRKRLQAGIAVVRASECGYSNRIHADDLARLCVLTMRGEAQGVFNATDGKPGKISEYLQQAAKVLGLPALPEISMQQAQSELSAGMLSYLNESRKISNKKLLDALGESLLYPDFKIGIRVG